METIQNDSDEKKELDDSGCVQDAGPSPSTTPIEEEFREPSLLDLSDDVLLDILKYCSPRDLKALGYSCARLGMLIRDRSLWRRVDAREQPTGRARMRWLLAHALGPNTTELLLTGYAREARGCLGHVNRKRKEVEEEQAMKDKQDASKITQATASTSAPVEAVPDPVQAVQVDPLSRLQRLYAQQLPRFNGSPSWPEEGPAEVDPEDVVLLDGSCPGPVFTLTQCMLRQLRAHCSLTALALDFCNVNCNTTGINHFPPTLKRLSLRGAKCYNLPLDKSFLFNIQDYLPNLEHLDLSECEWLEPAAFLPLSKVPKLTHLIMRNCYRLSEFVAYASLATRYGFRKLKMLDVRGSPVGDSEVSALGWLPRLEELYVSPAGGPPPRPPDHSHCRDERLPPHAELEPWELQEPEYFKIKPQMVEPMDTRATTSIDDIEEHIEQLRHYENNICLHGMEYNLCMEGIRKSARRRPDQSEEAEKSTQTPEATDDPTEITPEPQQSSVLIKRVDENKVMFKRIQPGPTPNRKTEVETDDISFKKTSEPSTSTKRKQTDDDENAPLKKRTLKDEPSCSKGKYEPSTSSRNTAGSKNKDQLSSSSRYTAEKQTDDDDDDDMPLSKRTLKDEVSCSKAKYEPSTLYRNTAGPKAKDEPSTSSRYTATKQSDDDDDDDVPLKKRTLKDESSRSKGKYEPSTSFRNTGGSKAKDEPSTSSRYTAKKQTDDDEDDDDDDEVPLKKRTLKDEPFRSKGKYEPSTYFRNTGGSNSKDEPSTSSRYTAKKQTDDEDDYDDDDEVPLKKRTLKDEPFRTKGKYEPSTSSRNTASSKAKDEPSTSSRYTANKQSDDDDDDDVPLKKRTLKDEPSRSKDKYEPSTSYRNTAGSKAKNIKKTDDDDDMPLKKRTLKEESYCAKYNDEPTTSSRYTAKKQTDDNDDSPLKKRSLKDEPSCSKYKDEPSTSSRNSSCSKGRDEPSTSSKYTTRSKSAQDDSDSSDDDIPLKRLCPNAVNEGASTSKSPIKPPKSPKKPENDNCISPGTHPRDCKCKDSSFEYVRFRQNMEPVLVRRHEIEQHDIARARVTRHLEHIEREEREAQEERDRQREREEAQGNQNPREARPRAHILYVNVGQQLHTVYRLSIHNEPPIFYSFARNSHLRLRPNVGNIFYTPPTPHLDSTSLVTDAAIRRFGRADVDDFNYIHIGNRPAAGESGSRPNRSSLRILSVIGFRNITNRSLVHLATAAPNLTLIDFTGTRVTAQGVESFRCLRPDCEVRFSEYVEPENGIDGEQPGDDENGDDETGDEEPGNDDEPGDGDEPGEDDDGDDTDEGEDAA